MTKEELFAIMKGTIIVSCQATPGEPLYDKERSVMPLMARAAKQAGAKMIRTSSVRDIVGIKEETGLPVIGLIKREYPGYLRQSRQKSVPRNLTQHCSGQTFPQSEPFSRSGYPADALP